MTMAEPENHTLRLLRDIRAVIESMNANLDRRFDEQDKKSEQNYQDLRERIERIGTRPLLNPCSAGMSPLTWRSA